MSSYRVLLLLIVLFLSSVGQTEAPGRTKLAERELLERCYSQLTGYRPPITSPLWNELKNNSATALCKRLLGSVNFSADGALKNRSNLVHRRILQQFHDFHKTWFEQQWAHLNFFPDDLWGGVDIYDPQEPALFLTRNLIRGDPLSEVLKGNETAYGLRDGTTLVSRLPASAGGVLRVSRVTYWGFEGPRVNSNSVTYNASGALNAINAQSIETPLIQMGPLYGVQMRSYTSAPMLPVVWTDVYTSKANTNTSGILVPQPFLANRGGGLLGSVPFIIMNLGHGFEYQADGAAKLPRRYILSLFKSLMCRQGPFLRSSDVSELRAMIPEAPAFRKAEACLRCHGTLDQAAMVLRNIRLGGTMGYRDGAFLDFRAPVVLATYTTDHARSTSEFWPSKAEPFFAQTPTDGKLFFRSFTGKLIEIPLNSLESLGQALAATPDFYTCAAKRYFEFFTQNRVELLDPMDDSNVVFLRRLTERELQMKDFVLSLGQELQAKGSLKSIVGRILESDFYSRGNFGR